MEHQACFDDFKPVFYQVLQQSALAMLKDQIFFPKPGVTVQWTQVSLSEAASWSRK